MPLLGHDLTPGQPTDLLNLLVDLALGRFLAEHATEVIHFRRYEFVVLREESNGGALKVAFRDGDELGGSPDLLVHTQWQP